MTIGALHFGHFTVFPAAASGAFKRESQLGQTTAIGMENPDDRGTETHR